MTAETIRQALAKTPFQPFQLLLDDGRVIPIKQRDSVLVSSQRALAVDPVSEAFYIIDLGHITALKVTGEPSDEQLASS